jgi:hypothetical protein
LVEDITKGEPSVRYRQPAQKMADVGTSNFCFFVAKWMHVSFKVCGSNRPTVPFTANRSTYAWGSACNAMTPHDRTTEIVPSTTFQQTAHCR